jgi:alpha-glucosidase
MFPRLIAMKPFGVFLFSLIFVSCISMPQTSKETLKSPDGNIKVEFSLPEGVPYYAVFYRGEILMPASRLGFEFVDAEPLSADFVLAEVWRDSVDQTWEQPWGEARYIRENYHELKVLLRQETDLTRELVIVFRVFDDGFGLRYEFPQQPHLGDFQIADELTEFRFKDDHLAWWIPAYREHRYEYLYQRNPLSELKRVHTPLTIETTDGIYLAIHEAALTDYAAMTLANVGEHTLKADLMPWRSGAGNVRVRASTPLKTPWRTVQIGETPGDLITSTLTLNLNEPNALGDVSWVKPGKYIGIWWGMHLRVNSWGSGPTHGATTENAKRYIDFAAEYGFDGVLVEGWNLGWDGDWFNSKGDFDFSTPYPDFDLQEVARYAQENGVRLIGHHETGGDVLNYERQMEAAYALFRSLGIDTVKTGYAAFLMDGAEWHHGQRGVEHYRAVTLLAAENKIMLDVHEPIKDTGIRRTYPNLMTREGARGMEFNAWSQDGGNPPEHTTIIPFTRMLSGPLDYTPGIFALQYEGRYEDNRVRTTLAKQLALYVVLYSPLQMAADLIENYDNHPAFQFILDVPVDWEETLVLNGEIGEYITIARKDRESADWYIGSITDEKGRVFEIDLAFLDEDKKYTAEIYADGPGADWESNPQSYEIRHVNVDRKSTIKIELAPGGGQAIRIRPLD